MKKVLAVLLALAMVFSLAACGSEKEEAQASGAVVVKVGVTGPLTGDAAVYGLSVKNAAEIGFEEINAMQSDYVFEFQAEDDQADPEKALNAYNALKDWGMNVMMGSVTSGAGEVTSAESYADRYFWLTPSGSSTNVIEGKDNTFQMCFTDPNQGVASADYISTNKMATKVAIIWRNDDSYSTGIHDKFVAEAAKVGLEIVEDQTFVNGASDFSVQVQKCMDAGADLVYLPIYYQPAALILTQAKKINYAPTWFGVDGMDGILTLDNFDTSLAEGVVLLTPYSADATTDLNKNFVAKYNAKTGETPNQFAADGYDCAYAIYAAVKAAGITADMDNSAVCDALVKQFTSMAFDGLTGTGMTWASSGEVSKMPNAVVIQGGVYVGL